MPRVSDEMTAKMLRHGDAPLLDSVFIPVTGHEALAEQTQGSKGTYLSSPVDAWKLHGPFTVAL